MPELGDLRGSYRDRTVLVTGHTGFKGAWLCEWLLMLGARVVGVALPPETKPALFDQLDLANRTDSRLQDIRDGGALAEVVLEAQPDYVFHLAAQSLVRVSYTEPVATYATNVLGTVHVLEALRQLQRDYGRQAGRTASAVLITTDKCYANREWLYGYREEDPLGGYDPYSSSKACAELASASFRQSFFNAQDAPDLPKVGVATARAGNVIGGGDWARDRIVPDCVRHLREGRAIPVRNPHATRPWQHVLEPLSGYLLLASRLKAALDVGDREELVRYSSAFNFGPELASNQSVGALVRQVLQHWPGEWKTDAEDDAPHEASRLNLAWDKAFHLLEWRPQWPFEETVDHTVGWYRSAADDDGDAQALVRADIRAYESARARDL